MSQRARWWVGLWGWLVVGIASCREPVDDDHDPHSRVDRSERAAPRSGSTAPSPVASRTLFGGCAHAGPGPVCVLHPRRPTLTLWMDVSAPDEVRLTIDRRPVEGRYEPAEEGWRWTLEVPPSARRLDAWSGPDEHAAPLLTLGLQTRALDRPALLPVIERVATRDREAARRTLREHLPRWQGTDRVFALQLAGALALRAGDREELERSYRAGVTLAREHGQWATAQQMAQTLAFHCIERDRDLQCGREWLATDAALMPFPTAMHDYYEGLLAERRGDSARAQRVYRRLLHDLRALGLESNVVLELAIRGRLLTFASALGDRAEVVAQAEAGQGLAPRIDPYNWSRFLNTTAWALLVSSSSAAEAWPPGLDPRALLERALVLLDDRPPGDGVKVMTRLNLAYEALRRDDFVAARRWYGPLEGVAMSRTMAMWRQLLQARTEQGQGRWPEARERLRAVLADTERSHEHGLRRAARLAHGQVLEQLGRPGEALAEYERADRILEEQLPLLGLGDQARFVTEGDRSTWRRVALLLARGDERQALCVARLARTRVLRTLHQRLRRESNEATRRAFDQYLGTRLRLDDRYDESFGQTTAQGARIRREVERQRAENQRRFEAIMHAQGDGSPARPGCESLSSPPRGSLDLHYLRMSEGWLGFAVDDDGTVTRRDLGDLDAIVEEGPWSPARAERLRDALLEPFAAPLQGARRVRVMPSGVLHRVPFHALGLASPRRTEPVPVVYGLDLPRRAGPGNTRGRAVVLAPPSNLPLAAEEASLVAQRLRARQLVVESIDGAAAARGQEQGLLIARALSALPEASWLHYVGHARARGASGWDSELMLSADGTMALGVADILALPAVPGVVVLSGCETGVTDPRSQAGGMSLAHAFLLAGSGVVVATTREIRDDQVVPLMRDFYSALEQPGVWTVPAAMSHAQRQAQDREQDREQDDPTAGLPSAWRLVRTWVP